MLKNNNNSHYMLALKKSYQKDIGDSIQDDKNSFAVFSGE